MRRAACGASPEGRALRRGAPGARDRDDAAGRPRGRRSVREGVARLLARPGSRSVGQAGTAESSWRPSAASPDVAIVDIRMPPTHTDEGLAPRRRSARAAPGRRRARPLPVRRAASRCDSWRSVAGGAATCSRTGSPTSTTSRGASSGSRDGGSVIDPGGRRAAGRPPPRARTRSTSSPSASARCSALMAEGRSNQAICDGCSSPRRRSRPRREHLLEARAAARPGRPSARAGRARAPAAEGPGLVRTLRPSVGCWRSGGTGSSGRTWS